MKIIYGILLPNRVFDFLPISIINDLKEKLGEQLFYEFPMEQNSIFGLLIDEIKIPYWEINTDLLNDFLDSSKLTKNKKLDIYLNDCMSVILNYWSVLIKNITLEAMVKGKTVEQINSQSDPSIDLPESLTFNYYVAEE